jgi:hypothetical protein
VDGAQFRANWTKLALRQVGRLEEPHRSTTLSLVGNASLSTVRQAGVLTWLPAEHHHAVATALDQALGAEGARHFWRDLMVLSFERSLLRPLVDGGLRVFGRTPRSVLRLSPQAYSLIARQCGVLSISDGRAPGSVRVAFDALPALLRSRAFLELCHGNCLAVLRYLKLPGTVEPDRSGLTGGSFHLDVTPT